MSIFAVQLFDTWYGFVKNSAALDPQSINQHLAVKLDVRITLLMHDKKQLCRNACLHGVRQSPCLQYFILYKCVCKSYMPLFCNIFSRYEDY